MPSHPARKDRRDRWRLVLDLAQIATAAAAILAVIASVMLSSRANETAAEALALARDSAERELARNFYLGELPRDYAPGPGMSSRAVVNRNIMDMYDVWVEGTAGGVPATVSIWIVQSCTGYPLPAGFDAERVHFFDGALSWTRHEDGSLTKAERTEPPYPSTLESVGTFDAFGCA